MKPYVYYNKTMRVVYTLSKVIIPYRSQLRGVKWYRNLAQLFVDICIYNACIAWKV